MNGYRCVTLVSLENTSKSVLKRCNVEELTTCGIRSGLQLLVSAPLTDRIKGQ